MPDVGGIAGARLKSFVERVERLEEEIKALNGDKKEVYAEAKGTGFDTRIIKPRLDKDDLDEQEALLDVYKRARRGDAMAALRETALAGGSRA